SLSIGWVGEPIMFGILSPFFHLFAVSNTVATSVSFALGFFILTSLHIVLGEQVPKVMAINFEIETALKTSVPLSIYYRIFLPLIWLLNKMVNLALKVFGLPKASEEGGHTREELMGVILESTREGVVASRERNMIESLFEFREKTVREVMVHRSEVMALDLDLEPRELLQIIEREGYSRLPVFRNSLDEISGVLHVKDILPVISQLERLSVPSKESRDEFLALLDRAIRSAQFISETQPIPDLLLQFQKSRVHMGIVVSEHGGVEGIVTLEDILEELVGDIRDESDIGETRDVIESGETIYVDATMTIADFNNHFEHRLPPLEESGDYQTISGYVQKQVGSIPNIGETIETNGLKFTITRKQRHKLEQIKIERITIPQTVNVNET
ncbi:MAG TPA: hemolysin family protein, partial [Candidatus Kapabacteria bacterium]